MERRPLGATGMQVYPLGLGGAEIGYAKISQNEVDRLIGGAIDSGCNVIDTAAAYAESEERIGSTLRTRRNEVFLFTKVGPEWSPTAVRRDIERSLRRLRCETVDLLQIWSAPLQVLKRGELFETMQRLKEEGLTRYVGYSGDSEAAHYAVNSGQIDALQTSISIADQEAIDLTLPLCRERSVGVIAKRPLANTVWLGEKEDYFPGYGSTYSKRLKQLDYDFMADEPGEITTAALRFTMNVPGVAVAIVGTKTPGRWEENQRILESGLIEPETYEEIRKRWQAHATEDWVGQQ